ncbi:MAG: flavin reductase family protein [Gemmatimonadota bacterium]
MGKPASERIVSLDLDLPIWDRFFLISPLAVIGTREPGGGYDLAPKHLVTPLGWENYFGFVCTPRHATYRNAERERAFTVSFPRPDQVVLASLMATPRCDDETKPTLLALPTVSATAVDGVFLEDAYVRLECELHRVIDGFGSSGLIAGRIVAAHVPEEALRLEDEDPQDLLTRCPLLAYLPPGRYACIDRSFAFPLPAGIRI